MNKAIFLDRDNTINVDNGYTHKIRDFKFVNNALQGLKLLSQLDYKIIIVTNQSGIERGYYTKEDFEKFMHHLLGILKLEGIIIEKYYFCPHNPNDNCLCRKPNTEMIKKAEKEFNIDLKKSFVIGNESKDIELGKKCGCKTILVNTKITKGFIISDYVASDLVEAAEIITNLTNINFNT